MFHKINRINIPSQITFTILPLGLIIMGDSILYVILPSNYDFFEIESFLGIDSAFWIGFILSINRFVRFFSNILSVKVIQNLGFRNSMYLASIFGAGSTLGYAIFKGVFLIIIMRIIWGFSYSIFRLSYQLKVFSYNPKNFGKYVGYCLSVQRFGSLIAVTLGVYLTVTLGYFNLLLLLSLLVIPAFILVSRIKEINIDKISKPKINWNLFYFDHQFLLRKNILLLSFFKFSSSFTSNGLAIATITPFLISINQGSMSTELILTIAGLIVGFRWIADIIFGVLFGYFSDKFGRKKNIIISSALMILAIIISILRIEFFLSIFCLVIMFFLSVSLETSLDSQLGEISPEKERSNILSRYSTWQDLGAAFGPIVGYAIGIYYGIHYGYILSLILIFLCLFFYTFKFKESTNQVV